MNRFVGLSLMCLMFLSAQAESDQAEPEFRGSSWSLQMSQDNGEPIKVKSERKEYDQTGVTLHRRTQGIIENGVYKPIDEQDLNDPSRKEARDLEKNRNHMPTMKHHPRRYGKNFHRDFRRQFNNNFKKDFRKDFRRQFKEDFREHEPIMIHYPRGIFGFEDMENMPQVKHPSMWRRNRHYPMKFGEKSRHHPQEFARKKMHRPPVADQTANQMPDDIKDKLKNRSRVSFYRPVEKLFEKIFGIKTRNDEMKTDFGRHAEPKDVWKNMPEFDDGFFDDEYFGAEE